MRAVQRRGALDRAAARRSTPSAACRCSGSTSSTRPGKATEFQKKYGAPYTLVGVDESGATGRTFGTVAMPVHVFIDRKGVVRVFRIGEMNPGEIESAIKTTLALQ